MQPPAGNGEWRVMVRNGWGRPFVRARPQFGEPGGGTTSQTSGTGTGTGTGTQSGQVFDLPEGIEAMAAVDAQNALLIRGTAAAVEELQSIIDLLDQPLRQVEVEAQFVTLSTGESQRLGIDFSASNGPFNLATNTGSVGGNFVLGYVGRNFQARLGAALRDTRAKSIAAPRVVAINNLTASIFTTVTTTVLLDQAAISPGDDNDVVASAQVPFQVTTAIGITVTPTINGDGTITVLMQPTVQTQTPPTEEAPVPTVTSQQIQTVAIVNDGDTIALGGLRDKSLSNTRTRIPVLGNIPILGKLFSGVSKSNVDNDLIIFLTARIVRRLPADEAIPGT
jgi:general secretion pathway protein D